MRKLILTLVLSISIFTNADDKKNEIVESLSPVVFIQKPIKAMTELEEWRLSLKRKVVKQILADKHTQEGYTECRETEEVPGAVLCLSFERSEMNKLFTRASIFSEGSQLAPTGSLVSYNDKAFKIFSQLPAGHDIPAEQLVKYKGLVNEKCLLKKDYCSSLAEALLFRDVVNPLLKKKGMNFAVISFSVINSYSASSVVSHEMRHAQFFTDDGFRNAVTNYWNHQLNEQERVAIRKKLSLAYDDKNETVMINEFQAYILDTSGEKSTLDFSSEIAQYQKSLIDYLNTNGFLAFNTQRVLTKE